MTETSGRPSGEAATPHAGLPTDARARLDRYAAVLREFPQHPDVALRNVYMDADRAYLADALADDIDAVLAASAPPSGDPWADRCGVAHPTRSSTWCYAPPNHDGEHVDGDVRWPAASPGAEQ